MPWSPGRSPDDIVSRDLLYLQDRTIVITEKMDGENTTLYHDGFHARSIDSRHHASRSWLAGFHAKIAHYIADDMRICGENVYARHSIAYHQLPSYFLGFSVWVGARCQGWAQTLETFELLGITPVREIYRGPFDRLVFQEIEDTMDPARQEGYVVRTVDGFDIEDFGLAVKKYVRAGHVQTDRHWQHQAVVPNQLA